MKWIKFEDSLPKFMQRIIVYNPNFNGTEHFICVFPYTNLDVFTGFTHWMPIPEKPNDE
jgi:hypothetical protein